METLIPAILLQKVPARIPAENATVLYRRHLFLISR